MNGTVRCAVQGVILNMNERAHAPIHVEGPGQGGSRAGRVQGREGPGQGEAERRSSEGEGLSVSGLGRG